MQYYAPWQRAVATPPSDPAPPLAHTAMADGSQGAHDSFSMSAGPGHQIRDPFWPVNAPVPGRADEGLTVPVGCPAEGSRGGWGSPSTPVASPFTSTPQQAPVQSRFVHPEFSPEESGSSPGTPAPYAYGSMPPTGQRPSQGQGPSGATASVTGSKGFAPQGKGSAAAARGLPALGAAEPRPWPLPGGSAPWGPCGAPPGIAPSRIVLASGEPRVPDGPMQHFEQMPMPCGQQPPFRCQMPLADISSAVQAGRPTGWARPPHWQCTRCGYPNHGHREVCRRCLWRPISAGEPRMQPPTAVAHPAEVQFQQLPETPRVPDYSAASEQSSETGPDEDPGEHGESAAEEGSCASEAEQDGGGAAAARTETPDPSNQVDMHKCSTAYENLCAVRRALGAPDLVPTPRASGDPRDRRDWGARTALWERQLGWFAELSTDGPIPTLRGVPVTRELVTAALARGRGASPKQPERHASQSGRRRRRRAGRLREPRQARPFVAAVEASGAPARLSNPRQQQQQRGVGEPSMRRAGVESRGSDGVPGSNADPHQAAPSRAAPVRAAPPAAGHTPPGAARLGEEDTARPGAREHAPAATRRVSQPAVGASGGIESTPASGPPSFYERDFTPGYSVPETSPGPFSNSFTPDHSVPEGGGMIPPAQRSVVPSLQEHFVKMNRRLPPPLGEELVPLTMQARDERGQCTFRFDGVRGSPSPRTLPSPVGERLFIRHPVTTVVDPVQAYLDSVPMSGLVRDHVQTASVADPSELHAYSGPVQPLSPLSSTQPRGSDAASFLPSPHPARHLDFSG